MIKTAALESFWLNFGAKAKSPSIKKSGVSNARFYLAAGLIALNMLLLMSYVYGVNHFASTDYEIKALQTRLSALSESNKKVNLKVSEAGSMVSIQTGFLSANFVPVGTPKFLTIPQAVQLTQR